MSESCNTGVIVGVVLQSRRAAYGGAVVGVGGAGDAMASLDMVVYGRLPEWYTFHDRHLGGYCTCMTVRWGAAVHLPSIRLNLT